MLALRVDFLNRVYHAADFHDPRLPEWPPEPDRFFQALVATAAETDQDPSPLATLEGRAPELRFGSAFPIYGRPLMVVQAYRPIDGRKGKHDPRMVSIEQPLYFIWADVPEASAAAIASIAREMDYLGRARSPVLVERVTNVPESPFRIVPRVGGGLRLRVPGQGRLRQLDLAYDAGRRPAPASDVGYARWRERAPDSPWGELIARRLAAPVSSTRVATLADAFRRAVLSVTGDSAPAALHGHGGTHAAWLALTSVGHARASGDVLGVGCWLPAGTDRSVRDLCVAAVESTPHLTLGERRIGLASPRESDNPAFALTAARWRHGAARVVAEGSARTMGHRAWSTVSPFVYDRHPRRGLGAADAVADSVELAGYPRPAHVSIETHSRLEGVEPAHRFRPRKAKGVRWTHVYLEFDEPVQGPMLIGRERHFGMGLCVPVPMPEQSTGEVMADV